MTSTQIYSDIRIVHPFLRADQRANQTAPSPATMIAAIASSPPCRESECNSAKD